MNASELRITDLRVVDINGLPKHCTILKIYTNAGIVGLGEVRDASSRTYALMLKSRLVGENPLSVEKLFRRIKQFGGHSRQGGGVSGVEIALWDIVGKFYGIPLYQLLGGKNRDQVRIYCDTDVDGKHTGTDMGNALKKRMEMGFTFLKMDLGMDLLLDEEGALNAPAGMLENMKKYNAKAIQHQSGSIDKSLMRGKNYEIFTIPHYATGINVTEHGIDILEEYVRQVREVIGYEVPLAIDHLGHIGEGSVIRIARRLEKYNIAWLEDTTPWMYTDKLKKISDSTTVPICTGEDIYLAENFEPMLASGAVSVVHPDLLTVGGVSEMKKLGYMCDRYGVALAIHMAESPIAFLAAVHVAAALKDVVAVEFHSADHPEWFKLVKGLPENLIENGFVKVPDAPGIGIEDINEEVVKEYLHEDYPDFFEDTSAWDKEWANDREWS